MTRKEWEQLQQEIDKILIRKGINPVTGKKG